MTTHSQRITDAVDLLLRPPTPEQRSLLEAVSDPFIESGTWPVMDYVDAILDEQGFDAERVRETFPSWPVRYSAVWPGPGSLVSANDQIGLTVAGLQLCSTSSEAVRAVVEDHLASLHYLADRFREAPARPDQPRRVEVTAQEIGSRLVEVGALASPDEITVRCVQLYSIWEHEFSAWREGATITGPDDWTVIVGRGIRTYAGAVNVEDYLTRVAALVLPAQTAPSPAHPSSLTLPEAIDYLDTVWRLRFSKRLFNLPGAARTASLSLPCSTSDEFDARLSALSDLLDRMDLPRPDTPSETGNPPKSLDKLYAFLVQAIPPDSHGRLEEAVRLLRKILALRRGQQHHGAHNATVAAATELGFAAQIGDWGALWEQVRATVVQALNTIREELQSSDTP